MSHVTYKLLKKCILRIMQAILYTSLSLFRISACFMEQEKLTCLHIYPSMVEKVLVLRRSSTIPTLVISLWKREDKSVHCGVTEAKDSITVILIIALPLLLVSYYCSREMW